MRRTTLSNSNMGTSDCIHLPKASLKAMSSSSLICELLCVVAAESNAGWLDHPAVARVVPGN
jgi:hypothetical protein